mmetsp:Transcript_3121/g.2567  ORF Transcript_3121/g.2567 Transcript_3121/m.2567 type:complete len:97 (-) Transcript_3121:159-449(-)
MMADGRSNFIAAAGDGDDESSDEEESGGEEEIDSGDIEDQSELIAALASSKNGPGGRPLRKVPRVEVEYEYEDEAQQKQPMLVKPATTRTSTSHRR